MCVIVSRGGGVPELSAGALAAAAPRRHRRATVVSLAVAAASLTSKKGRRITNGKVLRQLVELVARGPRARRRARAQPPTGMDEVLFGTFRVVSF